MSNIVKVSQNIARVYLAKNVPMNVDSETDIADFKDMIVGSIQVIWRGNDAINANIYAEVSNIPDDPETFDFYDGTQYTMTDDGTGPGTRKTKLFNLGLLGFRYMKMFYFKGSNTTGTFDVIALGKKG